MTSNIKSNSMLLIDALTQPSTSTREIARTRIPASNGIHPSVPSMENAMQSLKNAVFGAIDRCDWATVFVLLYNYPNVISFKDSQGRSILHHAIEKGSIPFAEDLLKKGAAPLAKDDKGNTPLHVAAKLGYLSLAKLLVSQYSADINDINVDGCTPLYSATLYGHLNTVRFLLESGKIQNEYGEYIPNIFYASRANNDGLTPLHLALQYSHKEIAEMLIAYPVDVNAQEKQGLSPLHYAAYHGFLNIAKQLILCGAILNVENCEGYTPLHYAIKFNHQDIITCLLINGADPNKKSIQGYSSVHMAANMHDPEVLRLITSFPQVQINQKDPKGRTPLNIVAKYGCYSSVEVILNHPCIDLDAGDYLGNTPLHSAFITGYLDIVQLLINRGACYSIKNNAGISVVEELINKFGHQGFADFLSNRMR